MSDRLHVVVFTGAGISAESGLPTFRGPSGLWEGYSIYDVATPEAWELDPETVLRFYNMRRKQVREAVPNAAHRAIAKLEEACRVSVITQNIDDLHERSGSTRVLHLHGEIRKARSIADPAMIYDLGDKDIQLGDRCEKGRQLRPHVVWFGEAVQEIGRAMEIAATANLLLVVGTSLTVHPAAGLVDIVAPETPVCVVNPEQPEGLASGRIRLIQETACAGVPPLVEEIMREARDQAK